MNKSALPISPTAIALRDRPSALPITICMADGSKLPMTVDGLTPITVEEIAQLYGVETPDRNSLQRASDGSYYTQPKTRLNPGDRIIVDNTPQGG